MTKNNIRIGVIGGGFVGSATKLLTSNNVSCIVYDIDNSKCFPSNTTFEDICLCEAVFIAVPTPITKTTNDTFGMCDTRIVSSVIKQLIEARYDGIIIVRSTVPVGFCDTFNSKQVHFMPEFLTEKNWANDFVNCKNWIFGLSSFCDEKESQFLKEWFQNLINSSDVIHKYCSFVTTKEAEMIKYFRNCFLAVKVSFCNEMYRFAESHKMDYDTIRQLACVDERIGLSHTIVPGPKDCSGGGGFGFGGSCFGKDTASLEYQMKQQNVCCDVLSGAIKRNNEIDRPSKDWM